MLTILSEHSLTPCGVVSAESMGLTLKERESTASLTPVSTDGIGIRAWIQDHTDPGNGIVWRVKSIRQVYGTKTLTVDLEHLINSLRDVLIFGEVKPSDMGGSTTCTAKQAVQYILGLQSDWVLGTFDYENVSNPYKFDGESLFDALETVSKTLSDAWWSYDFSVYPFKLNITQKQSGVACEMRAGRNLTALTRTIDTSSMYTRFYPIGHDDLKLSGGGYVERNTNLYGVVSKVETDQTLETAAELTAWANERLDRHAEPLVTIVAEGFELARATGEPLDSLTLGRLCRIPLPEFGGVNIEERITELNYQDKIRNPEAVKITLANSQEDVTRIIAEQIKSGGKGRRASSRQGKKDHAWFEDTDDHVAMVAEGIVGKDAYGNPNWIRLSQIIVDGEGIHQMVQSVQGDVVIAQAAIEVNESAITAEVARATGAESSISGTLSVEAGKVAMVVGTRNGQNYIKAAEIAVSINESTGDSEAKIDADHVYIGNAKSSTVIAGKCELSDVTADYIAGKIANIALLGVQSINGQAAESYASMKSFYGTNYYVAQSGGGGSVYYSNLTSGVYDLQITLNGNTYKLQKMTISSGQWEDVGTFSRATSLSGQWSGGELTVTASPQGNTFVRLLGSGNKQNADGTAYSSGNTWYVPILSYTNAQDPNPVATGYRVYVDASARYNAGVTAGKNSVTVVKGSWNGGAITFSKSEGTASSSGVNVGLSGSWSSGNYNYTIKDYYANPSGVSTGYTGSIALPSVTNTSWENTAANYWRSKLTIGGTTRTGDAKDFSFIANNVTISSVTRSGDTVTATASNGKTGTLVLTAHSNCKANVSELKINGVRGKVKIYYYDGSHYVAPFSDSYYWYRSSSAADPTTYYD